MNNADKQLLNDESETLEKLGGLAVAEEEYEEEETENTALQKAIVEAVELEIKRQVLEKRLQPKKVELIGNPKVTVEFPSLQKIFGAVTLPEGVEARVKFPAVQKVSGDVNARVEFPDIQKIAGIVEALVKFPDVQKVTGVIEALVKFPELQKVVGEMVITNLPVAQGAEPSIAKANPTRYIPVRLSNGKRFYDIFETLPEKMGASSRVSRLGVPPHDYISILYPDSTTEQFFYKVGGASGNTVAIVTVGYTDSTKGNVSYVQKV